MIKKIHLQGSAKEIGYKHGSEGREQVQQSLATYEKLFHGYQHIDWAEARERSLVHLDAIKEYDPSMLEEMEGIAEGAGVDFEDILALNARSEIALTGFEGTSFSDGCTAIAITRPSTNQTLLGQNWDWKGAQKDSLLLLQIESEGRPDITMITEGGIIGKIGFNSAGVGVCFNALHTDKKSKAVPIHLGLRAVLNSHSLTEAISKIKHGQMACAASFLMAYDDSKSGLAVNMEVSPFEADFVGENNQALVHTNHILSPLLKQNLTDMNEFKYDDSMLRKFRAEQLINMSLQSGEKIDEKTFESWLKDTYNAPNSINHFSNPKAPEHRQMETVFSIVMNLSEGTASYRLGHDVEAPFIKI